MAVSIWDTIRCLGISVHTKRQKTETNVLSNYILVISHNVKSLDEGKALYAAKKQRQNKLVQKITEVLDKAVSY